MAAKNKFLNAMKMPSIDDMFSSEADRQRESGDLVTEVPLSELHPFVGHPFEVRDDEDMYGYICIYSFPLYAESVISAFFNGNIAISLLSNF